MQRSPLPQVLPSLTAVWLTPAMASQTSAVQALPSSTTGAAPSLQNPITSQVSAPLHTVPSAQLVPAARCTRNQPAVGSQLASWQASTTSTGGGSGGVPGRQ